MVLKNRPIGSFRSASIPITVLTTFTGNNLLIILFPSTSAWVLQLFCLEARLKEVLERLEDIEADQAEGKAISILKGLKFRWAFYSFWNAKDICDRTDRDRFPG